eukprot:COSAG01_NODE_1847_length_9066_cov_6.376603_5_plen_51_part_00
MAGAQELFNIIKHEKLRNLLYMGVVRSIVTLYNRPQCSLLSRLVDVSTLL